MLKIKVFCSVTPCQPAKSYLSFDGTMPFKMLATNDMVYHNRGHTNLKFHMNQTH